jgi:glycosyltransferase involved in cell wall biosynthesis
MYNEQNRNIIDSIKSILNQSFTKFEYIIINDGSCGEYSAEFHHLLKDERIVYVDRKKNLGRSYSLNEGLHLAKGEFLLIHDADDISQINRLYEIDLFISNIAKNNLIFVPFAHLSEKSASKKEAKNLF